MGKLASTHNSLVEMEGPIEGGGTARRERRKCQVREQQSPTGPLQHTYLMVEIILIVYLLVM